MSVARNTYQIEREPFGAPVAKSVLLHVGLVAALALLFYVDNHFHFETWGTKGPQSTIQATLITSAAAIPLPSTAPPTPNVLATQTPSPAPAPPTKAAIEEQKTEAIPILARQPHLKPKEETHPPSPQHAQPQNVQHRAEYGEAPATQLPHAMTGAQAANTQPVNVSGGDFAAKFPWYVDLITRTVRQYWYTQDIGGGTPYGSQVGVTFTISRDGTVSNIVIAQPSASPTLNRSAVQAVQRVGSFQPLPSQYTGRTVSVEYTFTYDQPSQ